MTEEFGGGSALAEARPGHSGVGLSSAGVSLGRAGVP
jgi:hypothetical protein